MSHRDPLLWTLARARPADPTPREAEQAAVRVLARVAVLEAGAEAAARPVRPVRRSLGRAMLLVGAACLLLGLPVIFEAGVRSSVEPSSSVEAWSSVEPMATQVISAQVDPTSAQGRAGPGTWQRRVAAGLDGDAVQSRRLAHGGLGARRALLRAAEDAVTVGTPQRAARALALLRTAGALRGEDDVARVAALARTPALRPAAVDLLARSLGPYGAQHLEALLVEDPEAESDVVGALLRLTARGLREPGLQGLLAGARLGRNQAAAAALGVAGAADLGRVLRALPRTLRTHPAVVAALQAAPVTTRTRLVRLAARGDAGALALASAARVKGVVERLAVETLRDEAPRARHAVALLKSHGGIAAYLALARALEGAAGAEARQALRSIADHNVEQALLRHAQISPRDGLAVVAALAERGAAGSRALTVLTANPRLARRVLGVLEASHAPGAAAVLASLVGRRGLTDRALKSLGRRLQRGDQAAQQALLALAEQGHARAVLRVLRASGSEGHRVLGGAAGRALARGFAPPRGAKAPASRSI